MTFATGTCRLYNTPLNRNVIWHKHGMTSRDLSHDIDMELTLYRHATAASFRVFDFIMGSFTAEFDFFRYCLRKKMAIR